MAPAVLPQVLPPLGVGAELREHSAQAQGALRSRVRSCHPPAEPFQEGGEGASGAAVGEHQAEEQQAQAAGQTKEQGRRVKEQGAGLGSGQDGDTVLGHPSFPIRRGIRTQALDPAPGLPACCPLVAV